MTWSGKTQRKKPRRVSYLLGNGPVTEQHRAAINSLAYVPAVALSASNPGTSEATSDLLFTAGRDAAIRCFAVHDRRQGEGPQARFLYAMEDHVDWVNDLAVLRDTTLLASCSNDGTVKLWDYSGDGPHSSGSGGRASAATATLMHSVWAHSDYVKVVRYSAWRQLLVSAGLDQSVILWDLHAAAAKACLRGSEGRRAMRDVHTTLMPVPASVYSLAVDEEGELIVTGSADKVIRVFDARTGQRSLSLRGHRDNVRDLLLLRAEGLGPYLVSASADHSVRTWDLRTCKSVATYNVHHDSVWALAWYRGGRPPAGAFSSWPPSRAGAEGLLTAGRDRRIYFLAPKPNLAFPGAAPAASAALVAEAPAPVHKMVLSNDEQGLWVATGSSSLLHYDLSCLHAWAKEEQGRRGQLDEGALLQCELAARKHSHAAGCAGLHLALAPSVAVEHRGTRLIFCRLAHTAPNNFAFPSSAFPPGPATCELQSVSPHSPLGQPADPHVPDVQCMLAGPNLEVPGIPPIAEFILLNDKRHVLTRNQGNWVHLWDITTGRQLHDFGAVPFKEKGEEINPLVYVPSWCQIDSRLGSLMVHLDSPECFNAEVHAADVHPNCNPKDEATVNVGDAVLRALFGAVDEATAKKKRGPFHLADCVAIVWGEGPTSPVPSPPPSSLTPKRYGDSDDEEEEEAEAALCRGRAGTALLTPATSLLPHFRKPVRRITALDTAAVPQWVLQALQQGGQPNREKEVKISFSLKSADPADLPDFMPANHKLTAPRILQVYKVAEFVREKLNLELPPSSRAEPPSPVAAEDYIQILTPDLKVLDKFTDLGTVQHFFGNGRGAGSGSPLLLHFRRVPPTAPAASTKPPGPKG